MSPVKSNYIDVCNPAIGEIYAKCPDSSKDDLKIAIKAAKKAFNKWKNSSNEYRRDIILKIADEIEKNKDKFALAETIDNGKPISDSKDIDIPRSINNLRFYASAIINNSSESHSLPNNAINYTLRAPLGIVACISPWNYPLHLLTWKIAPALAVGNCVIAKPSEVTPMTAYLFSKICIKVGLPKGVLSILHGTGQNIGEKIVEHPEVKAVSFTGGTKTGKIIKETIANLTHEPIEQVMTIVNAFKGKRTISPEDLGQGKTIGFSLLIIFIMNTLGILKAIGKTYEAKIAIMLIVARITIQSSRMQALKWAKNRDCILDIVEFNKKEKEKLTDKTIYLWLDYIQVNQIKIENKLFELYYGNNPPKKLYYDVTSSYVTGDYKDSNLVAYGYNRDGKKGTQQIVIGLLSDENGHAVSIQAYPGNTNDVATFTKQLDILKNRFNLQNITIVGDGGMIKSEDIYKIKELGYDYITSIGKPSIRKLINDKNSKMQMSLFDEELQEIIENNIT